MREALHRSGVYLLLGLALLLASFSLAAAQAPANPGPVATQPPPPNPAGAAADLIRRIEDPAEREALLTALRALEKVPVATAPTTPDGASAGLLDAVANETNLRVAGLVENLQKIAAELALLPTVGDWFADQVKLEHRRQFWFSILLGLTFSLGVGAAAWWIVRRWMRPGLDRGAGTIESADLKTRLAMSARELAPTAAFMVGTGLALDLGDVIPATRRVGWLILLSVFAGQAARTLVHRLYPAMAHWPATKSFMRAGGILLYGGAALLIAGRLGLPQHHFDVFEHLLFFVFTIQLSFALNAARGAIAEGVRMISTWSESEIVARVIPLDAIANYGHVTAIALAWLHLVVWAIDVPAGFEFMLRATIGTLLVLLIGQLLLVWLDRFRGEEPPTVLDGDTWPERPQAGKPRSFVIRIGRALLKLIVLLVIMEAWGLGVVDWLRSPSGGNFLEQLSRLTVIAAVSWLLGRIVNYMAANYIAAKDAEGNTLYSNRLRTLVTIARSVALLVIGIIAGAAVLDELGIQTAPLLAGAGVIGLAIGFGSQKLVQDIITGLFILLGDTIRVGDVVNVGGRSGVVEAMTMRTVTLRSYNGDVHTIPYGAIDVVTNQTRDFSYWVMDIGIGYRESVDHAIDVLRELDTQLRREWPWRRLILEPVEIAGVDKFDDSAVVIKARVRTRPGEQWRVGRELNRRIKLRFDELGIEIPFPQRTVHVVTAGSGKDIPMPSIGVAEPAAASLAGRTR